MPHRLFDRLTPTACGVVSRAWVIERVDQVGGVDESTRCAWIDELCVYEPLREHGVRNNLLFWAGALGGATLTDALGWPGWVGFVAALVLFTALARALATRGLCWRLDTLRSEPPTQPRPTRSA